MNAIWVIAQSEFTRRVTSKGFVLTTLLAPFGLVAFFAVIIMITVSSVDGDTRIIAVVDETDVILERVLALEEDESYRLVSADSTTVRERVLDGPYDGYVLIPAGVLTGEASLRYYAPAGGGFSAADNVQWRIQRVIRDYLIEEAGIEQETLDLVNQRVPVESVRLTEEGDEEDSSVAEGFIGVLVGMMTYMALLIYGTVVMQGVMEEKQSRIVEVIVSSARPFNLLMGKVLGIGAMGLAQMAVWGITILVLTTVGGSVVALFVDPATLNLGADASSTEILEASGLSIPSIPFSLVIAFVGYFLGGYFLYAGLFAAVGAMVQEAQDAQAYLIPILLPIILSMVFVGVILENPHGMLATALSIIPFTSAVPMVIRLIVTDVPFWQLGMSWALLVAAFVGTIWISSRIYRVGILMYGKKASLRDIFRWLRHA